MQALRQRALDDAAVTAIAGAAGVDWDERRGPLPHVLLSLVSDPRPQTLKGFTDRRESRVQVDCRGRDRATVAALVEAAIAALVPAGDFHGVRFGRGLVDGAGPRTLNEQTETGTVHRDSFDLLIWHD